jgi:hypothetical protein
MPKQAPKKSPSLIDEANTPPREHLSDDEVELALEEALDPSSTQETLSLGGIGIQVRFLSYRYERQMLRIIAPYLRVLTDAAMVGAFEDVLAACLIEAEVDLWKLVVIILRPQVESLPDLPEAPELPAGKAYTPEQRLCAQIGEWVDENAHFDEMAELVKAQIVKNKLGSSLGKLWAPGVLGVGLLKLLNTLPSHITQALQLQSTASASATASSRPSA